MLCLPILHLLLRSAAGWLIDLNTSCHGEFSCQLNALIVPLFSSWVVWYILAGTFVLFRSWVQSVRDPRGPYLAFFYAPGVWYEEGVLLRRMEAALKNAHLPAVRENQLLKFAGWTRVMIPRLKRSSPGLLQRDGMYDVEPLTDYLSNLSEMEILSAPQRSVLARAIAEYYLEVLTAGAKRWSWRWKLSTQEPAEDTLEDDMQDEVQDESPS